ncbi:hypothetical protein Poly30_43070 [Planctomycetes bacterium Poly30]|uniref:Uncharacterized protein n=1 Tax=Saltatorellus ferox TaxID=2528018 RepID=A0A518EXD2_9BACT|nr:hypothetical protein Poly30_43070 [Planctomycetes bacterium Poly30]
MDPAQPSVRLPEKPSPAPVAEPDTLPGLLALARPTFLAWEKLRLLYVAILGALTLGLWLHYPPPDRGRGLFLIGEGAVLANLLYFAGPMVETYVAWLGWRKCWLRPTLFIAGTALSVFLVLIVVPAMGEDPF